MYPLTESYMYPLTEREILGLSTEHITRFKSWVPKWSKWRGLSMSEWIDIGWLSQ